MKHRIVWHFAVTEAASSEKKKVQDPSRRRG